MQYKNPGSPKITKKMCAEGTAVMLKLKKPKKKRVGNIGMKYNREEDRVRPIIIKALRKDGWNVKRVEPITSGKFALGDIWMSHRMMRMAGWGEIKSLTGKLSPDQKKFQEECSLCNILYWVIRPFQNDSYTMEK